MSRHRTRVVVNRHSLEAKPSADGKHGAREGMIRYAKLTIVPLLLHLWGTDIAWGIPAFAVSHRATCTFSKDLYPNYVSCIITHSSYLTARLCRTRTWWNLLTTAKRWVSENRKRPGQPRVSVATTRNAYSLLVTAQLPRRTPMESRAAEPLRAVNAYGCNASLASACVVGVAMSVCVTKPRGTAAQVTCAITCKHVTTTVSFPQSRQSEQSLLNITHVRKRTHISAHCLQIVPKAECTVLLDDVTFDTNNRFLCFSKRDAYG